MMWVMNETQAYRATLDDRLLAASRILGDSGYLEEVLDLGIRFNDNRWRLLVEYSELMHLKGFSKECTDFVIPSGKECK